MRYIALLLLVVVVARPASAHEIGTTRVSFLVDNDDRFAIDVVTDAVALADRLAAVTGQETAPRTSDGIRTTLLRDDPVFRSRLQLQFDEVAVQPAISYSVAPATDATSTPIATIHLTGQVPRGARTLTWRYAWTFASYALTVRRGASESPSTQWLDGGEASAPITLSASVPRSTPLATASRYLALGFTHILPYGFDHVLFVVGLFLLGGRVKTVLWQVSAFTVAHSITLALSMFGILSVPSAIVEPMIAVSIAYVAIENLFLRELKSWRLALVFAFGLLHGLGFAGALQELGLPRSEFITALVTFNIGVEAGQMTVIALAFALVGWMRSSHDLYHRRIVVPASLAIACTAIYWTIQRMP